MSARSNSTLCLSPNLTRESRSTPTEIHKSVPIWFWIVCFFSPIIMFVFLTVWNGIYPFGAESFLTEDLKYQYIDFFTWYRSVLLGGGSIFYSAAQSLGYNTWGLFGYYLSSPFNLLIIFFDEDHLVLFFYLITALKLGCIQLSCAWFLTHRFKISQPWVFLLSFCYCWCMWVATDIRNPLWLDALILLPLLAYASHLLIDQARILPLTVLATLDIIVCWYMAYITLLFLCLYVLVELVVHFVHVKHETATWVLKRALRFTGVLILALLLSAWTFLPSVSVMAGNGSSDTLGALTWRKTSFILQGFLPGGFIPDTTPQFFTGTIIMILVLCFLFSRHVNWKIKMSAIVFLVFLIISSACSYLEFVWCGFRHPHGFYSRTAFLVSFMMIWIAAVFIESMRGSIISQLSRSASSVLMCLLIAFSVVELACNAHVSWRVLYTGYTQEDHELYVDEAKSQLSEIKQSDSAVFYRMDKTYTRAGVAALNEGIALGFNQISSYSSTSNLKAVYFLNKLGYSSEGEFSTRYTAPILALDSLFGLRYASTDTQPAGFYDLGLMETSSGMRFYYNPYALSLGFGTSPNVIGSNAMGAANPFERQNALFSAILGHNVALYTPISAVESNNDAGKMWTVDVPSNTIAYSYVYSPSVVNWQLDDGEAQPEATIFYHSIRALNSNTRSSSVHTVKLFDDQKDVSHLQNASCLFYELDIDVFEQVMSELSEHQFNVVSFKDGSISGTYDADEDGLMLLTIPYDKGWSICVNGENIEPQSLFGGALMAIPVSAGENEITMSYLSPGIVQGAVVSIITLAFVIGSVIIRRLSSNVHVPHTARRITSVERSSVRDK